MTIESLGEQLLPPGHSSRVGAELHPHVLAYVVEQLRTAANKLESGEMSLKAFVVDPELSEDGIKQLRVQALLEHNRGPHNAKVQHAERTYEAHMSNFGR